MLNKVKKKFNHLLNKFIDSSDIDQYLKSSRIPWSPGYKQYRYNLLQSIPKDQSLLGLFANEKELPSGYGIGVDERVIEYPWVLSRINNHHGLVLDGGSVLNYPFIIDSPQLSSKSLVILTLAPESTMVKRNHVSYVFGDLRETIFRDEVFDLIVSISTLEHIGMNNSKLYSTNEQHNESQPDDYLKVIKEFHRILKPGGRFLMTVPFGKPQNLGWLYQFDTHRLNQLVSTFGSHLQTRTFYKYGADGWSLSTEDSCSECDYFDVHVSKTPASDLAAAARAVACLEFVKNA
jgi:hypothetical protein